MKNSMPNAACQSAKCLVNRRRAACRAIGIAVAGAVFVWNAWSIDKPAKGPRTTLPTMAIPIGVLGDSMSQSYQDPLWFPPDKGERGGAFRSRTFQWTEALGRLRSNELDQGPWTRGVRPDAMDRGREWLGLKVQAPVKYDYLYNQAISGGACNGLMGGTYQQTPRLVALMNQAPKRWQHGVVVIRIGQNDWSGLIDLQARDPMAPQLEEAINYCKDQIVAAIALIRASHPSTRILVVGILNEADDPANKDKYQTATATRNLRAALGRFNGMLRLVATSGPGLAYFDDDAWFEARWGRRSLEGDWDFRTVDIGPTLRIAYTAGDEPHNALLNDHHAGLAWNTLWAQSLVTRLNEAFGLALTPVSDGEVERLLTPLMASESKVAN